MTKMLPHEFKATRRSVFDAIISEREYQQDKFGGDGPRNVGDFILYMEDYLTEARRQATRDPASQGATVSPDTLDTLRKVVALGVACMEQHGAPQREGFEVIQAQGPAVAHFDLTKGDTHD